MAARGDRLRSVEFVEVHVAGGDLDADDDIEIRPPSAPAPQRPRGSGRRRIALVAVGIVVVLVGGLAVADRLTTVSRAARIVAEPGGLHAVATQPVERWRIPLGSHTVAAVDDTLVVVGRRLVGYDPGTGATLWTSDDFGASTMCEPAPFSGERVTGSLVCVSGASGEEAAITPEPSPHVVRIVDGSGKVVEERTVADDVVVPLPPGDVVRARLDTTEAVVTREDARTGAVRWTRSIERSDDAIWGLDEDGDPYVPAFAAWAWNGIIQVQGDGVDASLDENGDRVVSSSGQSVPLDLPDGLRLVPSGAEADVSSGRIVDVTGDTRWTVEGELLVPRVTDGGPEPTLLVTQGIRTVALRPATGERLWSADRRFDTVLARLGPTAVFGDYTSLVAVDVATGRVLWEHSGQLVGDTVLTDGERIVTSVTGGIDDSAQSAELVAIDLTDGDIAWRYGASADLYGAFAVSGRLVAFEASDSGTDLVGLG